MLINKDKTIQENLNWLNAEFRRLTVSKAAGTWTCLHCGCVESAHDPRCNTYATSPNFKAAEEETMAKIDRALKLLEEAVTL